MLFRSKCKTLKEKADIALKKVGIKELRKFSDKDEDLMIRREREISRRENMQLEDFKSDSAEGKPKDIGRNSFMGKGNMRVIKSVNLTSSVTSSTASSSFTSTTKPSIGKRGLTPKRKQSDKPKPERPKTISKQYNKIHKRSDLVKRNI